MATSPFAWGREIVSDKANIKAVGDSTPDLASARSALAAGRCGSSREEFKQCFGFIYGG
jgi:hypothetical protein